MRDEDRIDPFLSKFKKLWLQHPDLRFGQLVSLLSNSMNYDDDICKIVHPEEYEWSEAINKYMGRSK